MTPKTKLYNDILIIAVEHGIDYWAEVTAYRSGMDRETCEITKPGRATIVDLYDGRTFKLTPAAMRRGLRALAKGTFDWGGGEQMPHHVVERFAEHFKSIESGEGMLCNFDSTDADLVVQAAVLGKYTYA